MINQVINNNILKFSLEKSIYSQDVLFKCFYWYGNEYLVTINDNTPLLFEITISVKDIDKQIDWTVLTNRIKQDLIDYKLRDIVTKETKNVRELIVAKAFAYYQTDTNPVTEISDPVGFNPEEF